MDDMTLDDILMDEWKHREVRFNTPDAVGSTHCGPADGWNRSKADPESGKQKRYAKNFLPRGLRVG